MRRGASMDLEIMICVMPRLPCARGSYVATLRKVTNGIIENQYLRLVLTLVWLPFISPRPSPAPQVRFNPTIYDACSKSFELYANDYSCIDKVVYKLAIIIIKLTEGSFLLQRAVTIFMCVVTFYVDLRTWCIMSDKHCHFLYYGVWIGCSFAPR